MEMKKIYSLFLVVLILAVPAAGARAEEDSDFAVVGGVSFGFKDVGFDITGKKFKPQFVTVDVSFTAAYKRAYLTLDYDPSIKDYVTHDDAPNANGGIDNQTLLFSRLDYSATLGYNVWRDLNLFAGYKFGETRVNLFSDATVFDTFPPTELERLNQEVSLRESGPFAGLSYAFRFEKGSLSMSAAYAKLGGKFVFTNIAGKVVSKGDTDGLSIGLGWSGPLAGNLSYAVGYKGHRYKYRQDSITDTNTPEDFSSDVSYNMFYIGIANYF